MGAGERKMETEQGPSQARKGLTGLVGITRWPRQGIQLLLRARWSHCGFKSPAAAGEAG
jgi:hypothetical protein